MPVLPAPLSRSPPPCTCRNPLTGSPTAGFLSSDDSRDRLGSLDLRSNELALCPQGYDPEIRDVKNVTQYAYLFAFDVQIKSSPLFIELLGSPDRQEAVSVV
jgi:hypothetical protein